MSECKTTLKAQDNVEIYVYYLVYKLKQGSPVLIPVFREVLGQRIFDTTQLNCHLETVCVYVVPVLHATWKKHALFFRVISRNCVGK